MIMGGADSRQCEKETGMIIDMMGADSLSSVGVELTFRIFSVPSCQILIP